jgi:hypothetical protein
VSVVTLTVVSVTTVAVSVVTTVDVSEVVVLVEELSPQATKVPNMATKRSFFILTVRSVPSAVYDRKL